MGTAWEALGSGHGTEEAACLCEHSAFPPPWGACSRGSNIGSANKQLSLEQAQWCFVVAFPSPHLLQPWPWVLAGDTLPFPLDEAASAV